MQGHDFLFQAFVYLVAAVISVPIAKRFGFGSVLGYLLETLQALTNREERQTRLRLPETPDDP